MKNMRKLTLVLFATLFIEPVARIVLAIGNRSFASIKETFSAYAMLYQWMFLRIINK